VQNTVIADASALAKCLPQAANSFIYKLSNKPYRKFFRNLLYSPEVITPSSGTRREAQPLAENKMLTSGQPTKNFVFQESSLQRLTIRLALD